MKRILRERNRPARRLREDIQRIQEQFENLSQEDFNALVSRILAANIALARITNGETRIGIDFSDDSSHEEFNL
jgi:hypothetical protein